MQHKQLQNGHCLEFGETWETAYPIAFNLVALKGAQASYPVHEKELLAIICALTKWHTDLLGSPITICTDHRALKNFDTQKDLSWCQARWQEFLAHYNHTIIYIKDKDNTIVDALSCLPDSVDCVEMTPAAALLTINTDPLLLKSILASYHSDPFCIKLLNSSDSVPGLAERDSLLYIRDRLMVPHVGTLREDLF